MVQLDSGVRGINVDALLQSRRDLRNFDGRGVFIQFESSEDNETKFNDELAKEINISKYGSNKFLNEDNQIDFTFFPKKRPEDAEEAVQAINAIVDAGDEAEKQLEADTAEAEEAGETEAVQLHRIDGLLSNEEFARRTRKRTEKTPKVSGFGSEISGVLSTIIDDGEKAEQDIYARAFPKAAKIKAAKHHQKKFFAQNDAVDLTGDLDDYDASDVQIQFAE